MYASTAKRYCSLWAFPFGILLKVFKTHLLGRGFHTLLKNVWLPSPTNVELSRNLSFLDLSIVKKFKLLHRDQ